MIYDTASISTLHALAAARERAIPDVRASGLGARRCRVYCSDQTHSSIDKAVILLGLGHESLRKIPSDADFSMTRRRARPGNRRRPRARLDAAGRRRNRRHDLVDERRSGQRHRDHLQREAIWLHVDAAYAGVAAMVPGYEHVLDGAERADSIVLNPHKWLFTPFDLSVLYTRHMDLLREAFSLTPEYLKTAEAGLARNLMDTGIQLGRRFRALKLWMVCRHFGAEGLRARLAEHMRLARLFASWIDESAEFERVAPVPFSVVCFRAIPAELRQNDALLDAFNERLINEVNGTGEVFLSHTRLGGRYVIRLAIGNLHTTEQHVARAWELIRSSGHP